MALWAYYLSDRQGTGGWDWDFDWGIVPWPHDLQETVIGYTFAYFVTGNTPHPKAALRWINFLSQQPPQLKGFPARRSVAQEARRTFEREIGVEAYEACLRTIEEADREPPIQRRREIPGSSDVRHSGGRARCGAGTLRGPGPTGRSRTVDRLSLNQITRPSPSRVMTTIPLSAMIES